MAYIDVLAQSKEQIPDESYKTSNMWWNKFTTVKFPGKRMK